MSKEKQSTSVKNLLGKQVIDIKGALLGSLKDLKVTVGGEEVEAVVELKTGGLVSIPWSDIQSVEDFVLVKKPVKVKEVEKREVEKPEAQEVKVEAPPPPPPPLPPTLICPNCGAKAPGHAKFCPKCGKKLR